MYIDNVELKVKRFDYSDYEHPLGHQFLSPDSFGRFASQLIGDCAQEKCLLATLDHELKVTSFSELNKGFSTHVNIDLISMARTAILVGAPYVVIAHNHPAGPCKPSEQDMKLTADLAEGLAKLNIGLLEHFVVNSEENYPIIGNSATDLIESLMKGFFK